MPEIQDIYRINKELMIKDPYYGVFMMSMNKEFVSKEIKTAAVIYDKNTRQFTLKVNSSFWEGLDDNVRLGVIMHECLHVIFFHFFEKLNDGKDPELLNIAADMEVNQYIQKENKEDDWIDINKLITAGYKIKQFAGCAYYYDYLKNLADKNKLNIRNGECQIDKCGGMKVTDHADRSSAKTDMEVNEVRARVSSMAKTAMDASGTGFGSLPGNLSKYILDLVEIKREKVKWSTLLRWSVGKSGRTVVRTSRKKLNRRVKSFPGISVKMFGKILVCIDTSGSVSDRMLYEFWNELYHMNKLGYDIDVLECDADVSSVHKYKKNERPVIDGRGGTNYEPAIKYYNDRLHEYECCIYFTDGECTPPTNYIKSSNLIWIIDDEYKCHVYGELPGTVIKIEE